MKNSRTHFGCIPIQRNMYCVNTTTSEYEPFLDSIHLISDEVFKSEVDVLIRDKTSKKIIGQLGSVIEVKSTIGQCWVKVDSTGVHPDVIKYLFSRIEQAIPYASTTPYFVSEHINSLQPVIRLYVSPMLEDQNNTLLASWLDIEV